jgi:SAM-dependent methyltransferase
MEHTMPDHTNVYKHEVERYNLLISKQPSLGDVIEKIRPFAGFDIVDMGAGTGRLTTILAPKAKSIVALDASEAMLEVTTAKLKQAGLTNWRTQGVDHKSLPLEDNNAYLIVSGWSICYLGSTNVENWRENIRYLKMSMLVPVHA